MKKIAISLFLSAVLFTSGAQDSIPGSATIEFIGDELNGIINKNAKVEIIAGGFQFTEGPLWLDKEKLLLFSDVPANTIYKWTEAKGKEIYLKPAGYTGAQDRGGFLGSNGLLLSNNGELLICQHGDRRISRMDAPIHSPKPKFIMVAGVYDGKKLNSPNDLVLSASGDLYFTDPSYGFERPGDPNKEIPFQGVYRMNKAGEISLLIDSISQPNGIGIFPDGKTLLVSDSDPGKNKWYTYEISPNGSLTNGLLFYDAINDKGMGGCDGFKFDKAGNVFATGPGGLWIFTKSGKLIGKIKVNGAVAANCALTPDGKTIFITASNYLLRLKILKTHVSS
ncbi:MAG: SMP-30/gluconolactonase/LRE family protein [Chitinophagaceae bacterium]|nr:MAG: SMP-30/gluconolactonase/LRE family protein [Chitinophagaceae bacterium]